MYIKETNQIWVAKSQRHIYLTSKMANRHGLIAGATGTGKTVTSKVLAEAFSDMGIPVFMADIKGDVSGLGVQGDMNDNIKKRVDKLGVEGLQMTSYPVRFFDVYGKKGIPVRATISEMGPDLLARLLDLNDVQTGVLSIVFRVADDRGMLLLDLKDLRAMVQYVGENATEYTTRYGNIAAQSIGAIQRTLLRLEDQGGNEFFGEPALNVMDWFLTDQRGRGYINILHCVELFQSPLLYSTFMLWMLAEIYENLPESGDVDKPKMVFFFDEAHLLFSDAPKALLQKIDQVVKLIRSKGVGIYFITQVPNDIPDNVLSQLGNKVQHALRAFTPNEQKALRGAADSFRSNPDFDTLAALTELGTGEALVSFLGEDGVPEMVERAMILPPQSMIGAMDDPTRVYMLQQDVLQAKYKDVLDRESAYEMLTVAVASQEEAPAEAAQEKPMTREEIEAQIEERARQMAEEMAASKGSGEKETKAKPKTYSSKSTVERTIDSAMTTVGREISRQLIRGILGSLKR
jgi:DNA helicase HerA-like ATPase